WGGGGAGAGRGAGSGSGTASGGLRGGGVCGVPTAAPPRELAWRTLSTPLYPDSTQWRITLRPAGTGTQITESYQVVRLPPAWLDRLMARVNPPHIPPAAALRARTPPIAQ